MFQRYVYAIVAVLALTFTQANAQAVSVRELPDASPTEQPQEPTAIPDETTTPEPIAETESTTPSPDEALTDEEMPEKTPLKTVAELDSMNLRNAAVFRGLNKITAKTFDMTTPLDEAIAFGTLDVTLHLCWQAPPQLPPENKALLTIWENVPGEKPKQLFFGWMFASNPAISALNHPVYDLTLLTCEDIQEESIRNTMSPRAA